ncbi:MAG: PD-(D/E)XK nuclease family protein, partial [Sedimentibacter sp.]|uniref:PDDEXK-like family protein n=1 Tax=Sedimentibacter sp. TaxID=1960295 RepID=UPI0029819C86
MNKELSAENVILTDEEALKEFLLDIDCLNSLKPWISRVNIFDVLKVSRTEIRHSNMLSWLLDANENHGLNDNFIKNILQIIVKKNRGYFESKKINVLELLTLDFSNFVIMREWNNIDILLISKEDKLVICIENKIGSAEHDNQLERYQEKVEATYQKSEGYDAIYIFLTPDKDEASDADNWIS